MKKTYAVLFALLAFAVLAPTSAAIADTWGDQINDPTRFVLLPGYGGTAVLDQETGLVWEQSPSTDGFTWLDAQSHCLRLTVGNRRGWRLPTVQELATLVDPSGPSCPTLPPGHPFGSGMCVAWTATTSAQFDISAWKVFFLPGADAGFDLKVNQLPVWCVRGGQGVNPL